MPIINAETISPLGKPTITANYEGADYGIDYYYKAHFKNQLNQGYAYDFIYDGTKVQFDYSTLRFRGDSRTQNIDNPTNSQAILSNNQLTYPDVYGEGISLRITPKETMIKEEIIIENFNNLPTRNVNIINNGDTYLEINVKTKINSRHIRVNGEEWDNQTETNTYQDIKVYSQTGKELFSLLKPYAIDSLGNEVQGFYVVKNSANTVQLDIRFPYTFFETATYPVIIDPTINATINATVPSLYLFTGNNRQYPYYKFYNYTDITTQITDGLSTTKYYTYVGGSPYIDILLGYSFNQLIFNTFFQEFLNQHDAVISGTFKAVKYPDSYYGAYFNGLSHATITNNTGIGIADLGSQTACVLFNKSTINTATQYFYGNVGVGSTGMKMYLKNDGKMGCEYRGTTGNDNIEDSTVNVRDNNLHVACCRKYNDTLDLFVDGVQRKTVNKNFGDISSIYNLNIGADGTGANRFVGTMKQFGIVNRYVPDSIMSWMANTDGLGSKSISNLTKGSSIQVYFNHSFEVEETYFLLVDLGISDVSTIKVLPYLNSTHPNTSRSKDFTVSNGLNYLPISSIVYDGYNLPFRIYDILGVTQSSINDIYLFELVNDSIAPTINSCSADKTFITCDEQVKFSCKITDNQGIEESKFLLQHDWFLGNNTVIPNKNSTHYFYIDSHDDYFNSEKNIKFIKVNATDIAGLSTTEYPNFNVTYSCLDPLYFINITHFTNETYQIEIADTTANLFWTTNNASNSTVRYGKESYDLNNTVSNSALVYNHYINLTGLTPSTLYYYTLTSAFNPSQTSPVYSFMTTGSCIESWQNQPINISGCRINNTILQTINYVDLNSCGTYDDLPLDNGTTEEGYCNFCNSDWQELTGGIHDCQSNSTRFVEYVDYNSCYVQTGLLEDAPPLNDETWVACAYYTNDFSCTIAQNPYLKSKMEYNCVLPNSINDYDCINTITYNFDDVLQVNPQMQERSDSFLGINNNVESRDSFVTNNGLLNAYFTNKNLVAETPFTITTTCSDGNSTLVHQQTIIPTYKNIDEVPTYALWVKTNAGYLVVGFIMVLILIWLSAFLIKEAKYR